MIAGTPMINMIFLLRRRSATYQNTGTSVSHYIKISKMIGFADKEIYSLSNAQAFPYTGDSFCRERREWKFVFVTDKGPSFVPVSFVLYSSLCSHW